MEGALRPFSVCTRIAVFAPNTASLSHFHRPRKGGSSQTAPRLFEQSCSTTIREPSLSRLPCRPDFLSPPLRVENHIHDTPPVRIGRRLLSQPQDAVLAGLRHRAQANGDDTNLDGLEEEPVKDCLIGPLEQGRFGACTLKGVVFACTPLPAGLADPDVPIRGRRRDPARAF
jgi:hypothetical protein